MLHGQYKVLIEAQNETNLLYQYKSKQRAKCLMEWFVYIIECRDGSLYTGITNDLDKRLAKHNAGVGAKYTATRRPVRLVHYEPVGNRSEASKREIEIKRLCRREKQRIFVDKMTVSHPSARSKSDSIFNS